MRLAGAIPAAAAALLALVPLGCGAGARPEPAPAPEAAPAPAAPPPPAALAPGAVAGTYRLRADIERRGGQSRGARRAPAAPQTVLRLESTPGAAPVEGAPAGHFVASVALAGYTQAPRGRSGQVAAWWPGPADSVIVQWTTPRGQVMQLRGMVQGRTFAGEIWFVSPTSGATFQVGTFTATRSR